LLRAAACDAQLARCLPSLEPPPKRLLSLARPPAGQEALYADIFVQIRPVDPLTAPNEPPVRPLRWRPVCEAWEPGEGYRDRSAICKIHRQNVIAYAHVVSRCFPEFSQQSTHAMPPARKLPSLRPVSLSVEAPQGRNRGSTPGALVPARIWPQSLHAPHGRAQVRRDPPSRRRTGMARAQEPLATYPSVHAGWRDCQSHLGG